MKHIIVFSALLFTTLFAFGSSGSDSQTTLTIGYFAAPPHVIASEDDSQPRGLVVELWQQIAHKSGRKIRWKKMPLARLIKEVEIGRIQAGTLLVPTPQRKEILTFTTHHWDKVQPGIIVMSNSPLDELNDPNDLKALNIGYNNKGVITPWFKENNIKFNYIFGTNPLNRLLTLLESNKFDAVYWPVISAAEYEMHQGSYKQAFKYLKSPSGPYPIKPFFPKTDEGVELATEFDSIFPEIRQQFRWIERKSELIEGKK